MKDVAPTLQLFGTRGSPAAYAIRDFLARCDVPFAWIELRDDEQARAFAYVSGLGDNRLPLCVFAGGTRLENPTVRQVTEKLGWFKNPSRSEYDLSIYGAGPAGLSAAVCGASEGLKTVVVERLAVGGQAATSPKIESYLGFPHGVSGAELAGRAWEQASRFGAEILLLREGVRGAFVPGKGVVYLADGTKIITRLGLRDGNGLPPAQPAERGPAVGRRRLLRRRGERGLALRQCPGVRRGWRQFGRPGRAAFARYGAKVTMVVRDEALDNNLSHYLVDRIRAAPQIEVLLHTEVMAIHGDTLLRAITLRNNLTGKEWTAETSWLFLCIGGVPHTRWAAELGIRCSDAGFIMTGPDLLKNEARLEGWKLDREPYYLETSIPGVFAAGDVRHGSIKRYASAVGEGAMAVISVHRYLTLG